MSVLEAPHDQQTPSQSRWRKAKWPILGAAGIVVATAFISRVDPNLGGYPPCPLKAMTGLDCPGCGGLRCVHALASGDIATAMDQNLLAVILLPIAALWIVLTIVRRLRGSTETVTLSSNPAVVKTFWFGLIAVALVFTIVRNIPAVGFLPSGVG